MSATIHGYRMTKVYGDGVWAGEYGCSFQTWVEEQGRARLDEDLALLDRLVGKLKKAELVAFLASLGVTAYGVQRKSDLACMAKNAQIDAWWPRKFV